MTTNDRGKGTSVTEGEEKKYPQNALRKALLNWNVNLSEQGVAFAPSWPGTH